MKDAGYKTVRVAANYNQALRMKLIKNYQMLL